MIADFNERTGRKLRAEIEPGSFMVANSGILLAEVIDIMTTHSLI
jgi:diaminopimelate decarboxylase